MTLIFSQRIHTTRLCLAFLAVYESTMHQHTNPALFAFFYFSTSSVSLSCQCLPASIRCPVILHSSFFIFIFFVTSFVWFIHEHFPSSYIDWMEPAPFNWGAGFFLLIFILDVFIMSATLCVKACYDMMVCLESIDLIPLFNFEHSSFVILVSPKYKYK